MMVMNEDIVGKGREKKTAMNTRSTFRKYCNRHAQ